MTEYGITFGKKEKFLWPKTYRITGTYLPGTDVVCVGVDPGVNFGFTILHGGVVEVMWGKLPASKDKGQHGYDAYEYMEEAIYPFYKQEETIKVVIEGAAYRAFGNQVGLEEVRSGMYLAARHMGCLTKIVPPATVRKQVSGSGLTQAGDVWPTLKHDAADSIFCALYARMI